MVPFTVRPAVTKAIAEPVEFVIRMFIPAEPATCNVTVSSTIIHLPLSASVVVYGPVPLMSGAIDLGA